MTADAKKESERLMNDVLPLAKKMLREYGEFYPYGGYIKCDGSIVHVGAADPETDHPGSQDLIYILRNSFQEMARNRQCRAVVIVFDVAVKTPHSDQKSDAIQVCVDHVDGYSVEVFFPYQIEGGEIVYGSVFAQEGDHKIFAP